MAGFEALKGYKANRKFEGDDLSGTPPESISGEGSSPMDEYAIVSEELRINEIPPERIEAIKQLVSKPRDWVNIPSPIYALFKSAGLRVEIKRRGTPENRGDIIRIRGALENGEVYESEELDTKEILGFVSKITGFPEEFQSSPVFDSVKRTRQKQDTSSADRKTRSKDARTTGVKRKGSLEVSPEEIRKEKILRDITLKARRYAQKNPERVDIDVTENYPEVPQESVDVPAAARPEDDLVVQRHDKEAFTFPERSHEIWDRFVAQFPEKAKEYRDQYSVIREALERAESRVGKGEEHEVRREERAEQENFFDERFATEFGITHEELASIKGFEQLSSGQQKLVFENLREYANEGATPYIGHVWEGIKEGIGIEGEGVPPRGTKGFSPYKTILTQLIKSAAELGPKVYEENGELIPAFIDINLQGKREHRAEIRASVIDLNRSALVLSRTPAAWQEDGLGTKTQGESRVMSFLKDTFSGQRKHYRIYEERQNAYERAKEAFSQALTEAGYSAGEIAEKLIDVDRRVFEMQFVQTSPDAVEALTQVENTEFWHSVGKSLVKKSNLAYMGLGFLGRTVLSGSLGVIAAPLVSSALAGTRAFNRTEAELREKDRAARLGIVDTSEEALNIVSTKRQIEIGGETHEVGVTQKLQDLIDKFRALPDDASTQERSRLIARMQDRVTYMEDKQKLNRINFGTAGNRPVEIARFYETLGTAHILIAEYQDTEKGPNPEISVRERVQYVLGKLNKNLEKREEEIHSKRRALQTKKVVWNAVRAGGFALAGGVLAEYAREQLPGALDNQETSSRGGNVRPSGFSSETLGVTGLLSYTVESGDTLTKILREQIPEIKALGATHAQENAIQNILRSLSPEELKIIGISSGNVDLIKAGETIDVGMLREVVDAQQSVIDSARARFGEVPRWESYTSPLDTEAGTVAEAPGDIDEPYMEHEIEDREIPSTETREGNSIDATTRTAQVLEAYVNRDIFGQSWSKIKDVPANTFFTRAVQGEISPERRDALKTLAEIMRFAAESPARVVPEKGEVMESYLKRVYLAVATHEDLLPRNGLASKIARALASNRA